jgi:Escherichia/Staphylococcus phage prohead protease
MRQPEVRQLNDAEMRFGVHEDGKPVIQGYAAVFNSLSEDLGGFREVIRPGAFARGLAGADVRALIGHDPSRILGRSTSGTLRLVEDSRGLKAQIDPPDTSYARDLAESIRRGDMTGMSFRFYVAPDGERWRSEPGGVIRELTDVTIDDVSIVTYPAYPDTSVAIRSLEDFRRLQSRRDGWSTRAGMRLRLAETENGPYRKGKTHARDER